MSAFFTKLVTIKPDIIPTSSFIILLLTAENQQPYPSHTNVIKLI